MLPRARARRDVNIAGGQLRESLVIGKIGNVVHGIIKIEIVVVHAVHEALHVVLAGESEAALDDAGMFEERVHGVVGA